jgi:hypothetical protein
MTVLLKWGCIPMGGHFRISREESKGDMDNLKNLQVILISLQRKRDTLILHLGNYYLNKRPLCSSFPIPNILYMCASA